MTELRFRDGEVIFREGDDSSLVGQVVTGEVEVVREVGDRVIVLGRIAEGQLVGEMGALERRQRSATVRAVGDVTLRMLSREAFLERISSDKDMALSALLRLSERLHAMDDRLASAVVERPAPEREPAETPVTLYGDSQPLEHVVPREGIRIASFPFHVGRRPSGHEQPAAAPVALMIDDRRPYRLSRLHFSILRSGDGYAVGDVLSTLGTEVNGEYLGETFSKARAGLRKGTNRVVAGGVDSPYVFRVVVG
ncbi:MAG TPA: cyclic nucleotide-binding domain-containing protein [Geminicoccaceae bacterium]|nr:cyclic nucleotide-binding domain-containing protein [Geminicoccus sp.]HMU51159.1 cyclic nucleotide-binding domain-containing protein [Geminicoccaceae bacterium]